MANTIITISREYGSGGHQIGHQVAEALKIPFYDKHIIDETAKKSGFTPEFVAEHEEKLTSSILYSFALGAIYGIAYPHKPEMKELPVAEQIFLAQKTVIEDLAVSPCVIVGRCADYILKDNPNVLKVFIYADPIVRRRRAIEEYSCSEDYIEEIIKQRDKMRRIHYESYTVNQWGKKENYHLMLDSGVLGIKECVSLICHASEHFRPKNK